MGFDNYSLKKTLIEKEHIYLEYEDKQFTVYC